MMANVTRAGNQTDVLSGEPSFLSRDVLDCVSCCANGMKIQKWMLSSKRVWNYPFIFYLHSVCATNAPE